jgi:hypothetical protein
MSTNPFNADLDAVQILNKVYNPTDDTLRVDATVSAVIGTVVIAATTSTIAIQGQVSGHLAEVTSAGSLKIDLEQVGGAAVSLGSKTSAASIPVVIASDQASLPLPTGAATSANQTTANSSLATIVTNTTNAGTPTVSGTVIAKLAAPIAGTVTNAQRTIGITAVRATVSGSAPASTRTLLAITADAASTAKFYIGSSSVSASGATSGIQFTSSQPVIFSNDAADYWIISDTAGQLVDFLEQA